MTAVTHQQTATWKTNVVRAGTVLAESERQAAIFALFTLIQNDRERLTARQYPVDGKLRRANDIRRMELAFFKLGGSDERYWPAVYR
jgi:hypothetical protein